MPPVTAERRPERAGAEAACGAQPKASTERVSTGPLEGGTQWYGRRFRTGLAGMDALRETGRRHQSQARAERPYPRAAGSYWPQGGPQATARSAGRREGVSRPKGGEDGSPEGGETGGVGQAQREAREPDPQPQA